MGQTIALTYLGWQGWLFASPRARVMIDGLLVESVGRGPVHARVDFLFDPPRHTRWELCPPVDAYVISHEHEDHFNLPSLARLDRAIPLLVSARVSSAARQILDEMGFSVRYVFPGEVVEILDLELRMFSPDFRAPWGPSADEWDTLGYLVRCPGAGVDLFSTVDIPLTEEMTRTMNELSATGELILDAHSMQIGVWQPPTDRRDTNQHRPRAGAERIADPESARVALASGRPLRAIPGQTLIAADRAIVSVEPATQFLTSRIEEVRTDGKWFLRQERDGPLLPCDIGPAEIEELRAGLDELAVHLYGGPLYCWLYSIPSAAAIEHLRPSFVLILRRDGDQPPLVYAYEPGACSFVEIDPAPDDVDEQYIGAIMMWACDLLSLIRGEVEPRALHAAIDEQWVIPEFRLWQEAFWSLYHPQRFPRRVLARYRRQLAEELADPATLIRFSGG